MKRRIDNIKKSVDIFLAEPITKYVVIITSVISALMILEALIDGTQQDGIFLSMADKQLAMNFVEWFGVLYGFLLPTILVRVWEQFDEIDNILDREADAVKSLMGDLLLLDSRLDDFKKQVLCSLFDYSHHIIRFINGKIPKESEVKTGEKILKDIRKLYIKIFSKGSTEIEGGDVLKDELLTQLNNIIDYRGDRISLSTQRLFESLNFIAVVTSITWLVPFYFLYFQDKDGQNLHLGMFGWLLIILVTFLIIIILSIIDDLDSPFDGYWRVNIESWEILVVEIKAEYKSIRTNSNHQPDTSLPGNESVVVITQSQHQITSPLIGNVEISKPARKKTRRKKNELVNTIGLDEPVISQPSTGK